MSTFTLTATRGDTIRLAITATRDGSPLDLTGATLWMTAKVRVSAADDDPTTIQKTSGAGITVTDAAAGEALVVLAPADTSGLARETSYVCDVQVKEANGVVTTVASGTLTVLPDVTRTA